MSGALCQPHAGQWQGERVCMRFVRLGAAQVSENFNPDAAVCRLYSHERRGLALVLSNGHSIGPDLWRDGLLLLAGEVGSTQAHSL